MNKKILIIVSILLITVGMLLVGLILFNKQDDKKLEKTVIDMIKENQELNILLTERNLTNVKDMYAYYKEVYGLKYYEIDNNDKEYKQLIDMLNINEDLITLPCFMKVKNGVMTENMVGITNEKDIKNYLIENGYIDKKYNMTDNYKTDEEINEISDNVILYIEKEEFSIRKKLIENDVNYSIVKIIGAEYIKINKYIEEKIGKIKLPALVKIQNDTVKYVNDINSDNIMEKLEQLK